MKKIILIVFSILCTAAGFAGPEQELLIKASKAYNSGNFAEASGLYRKVANDGFVSPELFYNLGNCYFKLNDYPSAILWYERAKRLDPGDEDIDFNLNVVNTKISDKIEPLPEMFYKRWFNGLVNLTYVDGWAVYALVFFILALAGGVLYLVSRVLIIRKIGFWSGSALLLFGLIAFMLAWSGDRARKVNTEAVIFAPTITVKSSPNENSTDLFVLHEGTKVKLLDNIGAWYEIRIANGSVGWLPVTALERI
jgi:tetratricopeptide (TPR) repeat protein